MVVSLGWEVCAPQGRSAGGGEKGKSTFEGIASHLPKARAMNSQTP